MRTLTLGAMALLGIFLTGGAEAAPMAKLSASFIPERLGGTTTLEFAFAFTPPAGQVPPPLTQIQLRYPDNLGLGLSGLGLATCAPKALEASGPSGCPPDSVMGYGAAITGIVLGSTIISESAPITILRTENQGGHIAVLFSAEGTTPVDTRILFPGILLPAPSPFGGQVSVGIPLVPTLPGAPYISVISLRATIGPKKVTYYENAGGRTLAYTPKGILLPKTCPPRGFPFSAQFGFNDGSTARARSAIACPAQAARRHQAHTEVTHARPRTKSQLRRRARRRR
jgi:hypothetical protein